MILLPIIIVPTVLRLLLHSIKLIALKIELVFLSSSEDKLVQHWTLKHWNWSTIRPPVQLSFCLWRSISTIYNNYHSKQPENKNKTNKWSANYKKKKQNTGYYKKLTLWLVLLIVSASFVFFCCCCWSAREFRLRQRERHWQGEDWKQGLAANSNCWPSRATTTTTDNDQQPSQAQWSLCLVDLKSCATYSRLVKHLK